MRTHLFSGSLVAGILSALLLSPATFAQTPATNKASTQSGTELLWLGQAGFRIKSPNGKIILIDPWITGGPKAPPMYKNDLAAIGPVGVVSNPCSHGPSWRCAGACQDE
ncbi:hypothetical protein POAR111328_00325 [Polynucleobacter arcticus]|nr:hypothetical protein [Polynucleobacter arcticus]